MQTVLDVLTEQRNAAMNQAAQSEACLRVAMAEIERLTAKVAALKPAEQENPHG